MKGKVIPIDQRGLKASFFCGCDCVADQGAFFLFLYNIYLISLLFSCGRWSSFFFMFHILYIYCNKDTVL